jgi:hypothetical protein
MRILLAAILLSLGVAQATAQENGYAVRQTEMKKEPYTDADTVATLAENARVKVLKREGGWMQIESGQASGWVRMLSVRMSSTQQSSGYSGFRSLFNIARTGSTGQTVTTGVRGLDKEQIQNAKPNPAELQKLTGFAASKSDAQHFAAGNPALKQQTVEYLPAASTSARQ